jgi:hypothetical protein
MDEQPPRNGIRLDLDDVWPTAETLVAMQFASQEDYNRCQAILWELLELYHWDWPRSLRVGVRKTDKHLFTNAGLSFTEHEVVDADPSKWTEEERTRYRDWMREMNRRNLLGLSLEE